MDTDERVKLMMKELGISEEKAHQIIASEFEFENDLLDGVPLSEKKSIVDLMPEKLKE